MRRAPLLFLAVLLAVLPAAAGGAPQPAQPRAAHTATLLADGRVLLAGGCTAESCELDERGATTELFDPGTGRFVPGPPLLRPRVSHGAVRLRDGSVLVFGGWDDQGVTGRAEILRPGASRFAAAPPLRNARGGFTWTVLRDGRVLVVGGSANGSPLRSAELYDPATGRFRATGSLRTARVAHAAALLPDGRVLVAGGERDGEVLASVEIWSPRSGRFTPARPLREARHKHAAVPVRGGVLVLGGSDVRDFRGRHASAELYLAGTGRWATAGPLAVPRFKFSDAVVPLPGGGALAAGGGRTAELYDPARRRFVTRPGPGRALSFSTATRLRDGRVLVAGGYDDRISLVRAAWLLRP